MAQIKKLEPGGTVPVVQTPKIDRTDIKKTLWDEFYKLSSKDQKKSHEQYKQVEGLLDLPNFEEVVKFNPDRTYSIDVEKLPEELKNKDWSGHQGTSLDKGFLGLQGYTHGKIFGSKEENIEERQNRGLSGAMADLSTVLQKKETSTAATPKIYGKNKIIPEFGAFLAEGYKGNAELGMKDILSKTEEEKKKFLIDKVGNLLSSYKTGYETNLANKGLDIYDEKDRQLVEELSNKYKALSGDTDITKYKDIFNRLGINTEDYLKSADVLKAEGVARTEAEAAELAAAEALRKSKLDKIPKNYIITTKHYSVKKRLPVKPAINTATGSGKIGEILEGKGSTADYLDAVALGGDVVSLGGTIPGIVGGLTSTGATLASDILRGHSFGETAGNAAMNLGFTALALIPGAASAKLGIKGVKTAAEIAKVANKTEKAEKILKVAKEAIKSADGLELAGKELVNLNRAKNIVKTAENLKNVEKGTKVLKYGLPELKSVGKPLLTGTKKISKVVKPAFLGYGLFNAGTAARQTAQDIEEGGVKNISIQDLRGLTHGVQAIRGLKNLATIHAGSSKIKVQEATKEIKLKNAPEGVDSKIIIPKGSDPKVKIEEHFDKVIIPKSKSLEELKSKTTPSESELKDISKLEKELEVLKDAKIKAKLDKGFLGISGKLSDITGKNSTKEVKERIIKNEYDPRSWYGKKFQEHAIKQLQKGEKKNIKQLSKDTKAVLGLDRSAKATDYKKNIALNKRWRDYQKNIVEHKDGGIVKHQISNKDGIIRNTVNVAYKNVPKNLANYLPYGEPSDFQKTPEWETFRKNIPETKFKEYLPELNKQITATGSSVQFTPKDYSKFTRLVTDKYPGPVQNFVMGKYQETLPVKEPALGGNIGPKKEVKPVISSGESISSGSINKEVKKPFDWQKFASKIDPIDIGNAAMYLHTLNANKNIAGKQIQAALNVPLKTLQPNQNIVMYNPYNRLASNVKAEVSTLGNKMASRYSDANKGMAAQMEMFGKGETAAAGYRDKGAEIYNKGIQAQRSADYATNVGNIGIADSNMAAIKKGQSSANLVEANKSLVNDRAFQAYTKGVLHNLQVKKGEKDYSDLLNLQTGKEAKELQTFGKGYDKRYADEMEKYKKAKAVDEEPWEKSQEYAALLAEKAQYEKGYESLSDRIKTAQLRLQYPNWRPQTYKKGGGLTKQDKIDIDNIKAKNKSNLAQVKDLYKSILEDNKLTEKSLIKVFK